MTVVNTNKEIKLMLIRELYRETSILGLTLQTASDYTMPRLCISDYAVSFCLPL